MMQSVYARADKCFFSVSLCLIISLRTPSVQHTRTHTSLLRGSYVTVASVCPPDSWIFHVVEQRQNAPYICRRQTKIVQLESLPISAFPQNTVLGSFVQSLLKLSHVIYPITLQCYTTFDWKVELKKRLCSSETEIKPEGGVMSIPPTKKFRNLLCIYKTIEYQRTYLKIERENMLKTDHATHN